jgi:hypothetical protein
MDIDPNHPGIALGQLTGWLLAFGVMYGFAWIIRRVFKWNWWIAGSLSFVVLWAITAAAVLYFHIPPPPSQPVESNSGMLDQLKQKATPNLPPPPKGSFNKF